MTNLKSLMKSRDRIVIISHCTSEEHYTLLIDFLQRIEDFDLELIPVSELFASDLPEIL